MGVVIIGCCFLVILHLLFLVVQKMMIVIISNVLLITFTSSGATAVLIGITMATSVICLSFLDNL